MMTHNGAQRILVAAAGPALLATLWTAACRTSGGTPTSPSSAEGTGSAPATTVTLTPSRNSVSTNPHHFGAATVGNQIGNGISSDGNGPYVEHVQIIILNIDDNRFWLDNGITATSSTLSRTVKLQVGVDPLKLGVLCTKSSLLEVRESTFYSMDIGTSRTGTATLKCDTGSGAYTVEYPQCVNISHPASKAWVFESPSSACNAQVSLTVGERSKIITALGSFSVPFHVDFAEY